MNISRGSALWAPWQLLCRWLRPLRMSKRAPALVASIVSVLGNEFSSPLPAKLLLTEAVIKLLLRALYGAGS